MPLPPERRRRAATLADQLLLDATTERLGLWRYEERLVRLVIEILNDADDHLVTALERALERGRTDAEDRLRRVRAGLAEVLDEAYRVVERKLSEELIELAGEAVQALGEGIARALPFAWDFGRPDPETLVALARGPFRGRLLSEHVEGMEANRLAELTRVARNGILEGASSQEIARRFRGTAANNYGDGALNMGRVEAERLSRTTASHVHAEARFATMAANDDLIKGVMAVVTFDDRTCRICQPRDGLVWDLDRKPVGHEVDWDGGPGQWHWLCRCTSIPVLKDTGELEDAGLDLSRLGTGERASIDGPVSVDLDYGEWLRDQPLARKEEVLGKARAAWWEGHPDLSLERAWARSFGGKRVDPR